MIVGDLVARFTGDTSGLEAAAKRMTNVLNNAAQQEQEFRQVAIAVTDALEKQGFAFKSAGEKAAFMQSTIASMRKEQAAIAQETQAMEVGIRKAMESQAEGYRKAAEAQKAALPDIAARSFAILRGEQEKAAVSARMVQQVMGPLAAGIALATRQIKDQSPATAALVSSLDGLVLQMTQAVLVTGSFSAALRAFAGPMGIISGLIIAAGAALAYYSAKSEEAKKNTEELRKIQSQTELFAADTPRATAEIRHLQKVRDIIMDNAEGEHQNRLLQRENARFAAEIGQIERKEATETAKKQAEKIKSFREGLDDQIDGLREQQMAFTEGEAKAKDFAFQMEVIRKFGEAALPMFQKQRDALFSLNSAIEEHKKKVEATKEVYKDFYEQSKKVEQATQTLKDAEDKVAESRGKSGDDQDVLNQKLREINKRWNEIMVSATEASLVTGQVFDFDAAEIARQLELIDAQLAATVKRINEQAPKGMRPSGLIGEEWMGLFDSITQGFDQTFQGIIMGTQTFAEGMKNLFRNMVLSIMQELIKLSVINPLKNALFGTSDKTGGFNIAGLIGTLGSAIFGGIFGGGGGITDVAMAGAGQGFAPVPFTSLEGATTPLTNVTVNGSIIPNAGVTPDQVIQIGQQQLDNRGVWMQTIEQRSSRR